MPAPVLPAHVATGELITSAWGNGVVDSLQYAPVQMGGGSYPITALVNSSTILHQSVPSVPYATRMVVVANGWAGSDSGNLDGVNVRVQTGTGPGTQTPSTGGATPGRFAHTGVTWQWLVPANGNAQVSLAVGWVTTSGGTTYVAADIAWWMFRQ